MKKLYSSVLGLSFGLGIFTNYIPVPSVRTSSDQTLVQAQETRDLQNLTGHWQVRKIVHGDSVDEQMREDVYFAIIKGNLVGVINTNSLLNLTISEDQTITGEIILFDSPSDQPITVKLEGEIANNDQEINLKVKFQEFDLSTLSLSEEELKNTQEFMKHDLMVTIEKMTPEKLAEAEIESALSMIARGQHYYYLEKNEFTEDLEQFAFGFTKETEFYDLKLKLINPNTVRLTAIPKQEGLKSYVAGVFAVPDSEYKSKYIICSTEDSSIEDNTLPKLEDNEPSCPSGFKLVESY